MSKSLSGLSFTGLVKRGLAKHGIDFHWTEGEHVTITFSRSGTPIRTFQLFGVTDTSALSVSGSPLCAADVVQQIRARLESRRV